MDDELYPTVEDILTKAKNPENLFLSIYSQDEEHPDLTPIFKNFPDTKYKYEKVHVSQAKGVGYARTAANRHFNSSYGFYLQIDSHSRFEKNWDIKIITDYTRLHEYWGKMVFSSYAPAYNFETNELYPAVSALQILPPEKYGIPFSRGYAEYTGGEYGQETGFMSGHFLFGYAEYILEVPYDPSIYFEGEEHSMSVRLYKNRTRIICPPNAYVYHDYDGRQRNRHWDKDSRWTSYEYISMIRIRHLFNGKITDKYGLTKEDVDFYLERFLPSS